jgi:hypothetical protein
MKKNRKGVYPLPYKFEFNYKEDFRDPHSYEFFHKSNSTRLRYRYTINSKNIIYFTSNFGDVIFQDIDHDMKKIERAITAHWNEQTG